MKFMAPTVGEISEEERKRDVKRNRDRGREKEKKKTCGEKRRVYSRTWNKIVRSLHKTLEGPSKARNEIPRFADATT